MDRPDSDKAIVGVLLAIARISKRNVAIVAEASSFGLDDLMIIFWPKVALGIYELGF
jgi:hypothetical protein